MPVVSRDEMKEGYVSTVGLPHSQLPADTNGLVSGLFFEIVNHYLAGRVSVVIEAAFQHKVWEARMPQIMELASPALILCEIDGEVAAIRHLQRGLEDARREFYHGDERVAHYRKTGEILPPDEYITPQLDIPIIRVSTESEYSPSLDEIVRLLGSGSQ